MTMKMRSTIFFTVPLSCILFVSCNSNQPETDPTLPQVNLEQLHQQPSQGVVGDIITSDDGESPAGAIAYNPPHGQPGHDCSIAVGAPLNRS